MKPSVGRIVHYVSYGTPGGEYASACRAAIITSVVPSTPNPEDGFDVGLCVLNPEGQYFNQDVPYDDGDGTAGAADCPLRPSHGYPFRHCSCGWTVGAAYRGGTWHWPEHEAVGSGSAEDQVRWGIGFIAERHKAELP